MSISLTTYNYMLISRKHMTACREGSCNLTRGRIWHSLKQVLAFQTLMLPMLGKWTTSHENVFSWARTALTWTLLPGLTWLKTLITRLHQLHSKLQNTFLVLKTCRWLAGLSRLYDVFESPGSYARYFKIMLEILVDRALTHHIFFFFDSISFDTWLIQVLCFTSQ